MGALYFRTYTGRRVHPLSPDPSEINIVDIARSLSNLCRFLGHTKKFYSVAQHSVLVSELLPREDALWGLLHDAPEAYLCDMPSPIKHDPRMNIYQIAEARLMLAVCQKFGLRPEIPRLVMLADKFVLATEFRDVTTVDDLAWITEECGIAPWPGNHITPWGPAAAEATFLARFEALTK